MKILQINASYKPAYIYGGPTRSVSKLSEQLVKAGCEVIVFTTTANGEDELAVPVNQAVMVDDVQVWYFTRVTKDHSHFSPTLLFALWKQVKKYDVVHIHAWWNLVSVLSCLIAQLRGIPVVLSPRGTLSQYSFQNKNAFYKNCIHYFLGKWLLKKCFIHVTSEYEKERLTKLIKPQMLAVIYNFIDLPINYYPAKGNLLPEKLKLLFLSRIDEKKGLDMFIQALSRLSIPYHLTIAGDGDPLYIESLKKLIDDQRLTQHVDWIGFQHEHKFEVLKDHDLLVLPSHDENFGNVVIESLSVGTAVLVSDKVGLADYVLKNNFGWVCKPEPSAIAESINTINPLQLISIRDNAPAIISSDFDELNLAQRYIAMYQQIIQQTNS